MLRVMPGKRRLQFQQALEIILRWVNLHSQIQKYMQACGTSLKLQLKSLWPDEEKTSSFSTHESAQLSPTWLMHDII